MKDRRRGALVGLAVGDALGAGQADKYWQAVLAEDDATCRSLRGEVRAEEETGQVEPAYWWISANEKIWTWDTLFKEGEQFFTAKRIARNFRQAKAGDLVFGYLSHPHKNIVALARIKEELHTREEEGKEVEGIVIEPVKQFDHPVGWATLLNNPILKVEICQDDEYGHDGCAISLFLLN